MRTGDNFFLLLIIIKETFLKERIKVNGKCQGKLAKKPVKVWVKDTLIHIAAPSPFSKRYLKYLSKKYLKKHELRDWLRVIATSPSTYELRYFKIHDDEDESDEEGDEQ